MKREALGNSPRLFPSLADGVCAYWPIDRNKARFEQLGALYRVLDSMMRGELRGVSVGFLRDHAVRQALAREALYVALVDGRSVRPKHELDEADSPCPVHLFGGGASFDGLGTLDRAKTLAGGTAKLAGSLASLPRYRQYLDAIARNQRWGIEDFSYGKIQKHEAGASVPLARVHLSHAPKNALLRAALVGRCDCVDGGGNECVSGGVLDASAVVLSLMQALAEASFPLQIDAWLAVMNSSAGTGHPRVTIALDGTELELPRIDAGSRGALVDALCQATRSAPHIIIDFATFSGVLARAAHSSGVRPSPWSLGIGPWECGLGGDTFGGGAGPVRERALVPDREADRYTRRAYFHPGGHESGADVSAATIYALNWGVELLARWLEQKPANSKPRS